MRIMARNKELENVWIFSGKIQPKDIKSKDTMNDVAILLQVRLLSSMAY